MADLLEPKNILERYQRLQRYVGWTADDAARVRQISALLAPIFDDLVNDFYAAIEHEPRTARIVSGGRTQILRLKDTLREWLKQLFAGPYDETYVTGRWRVGWRHVEIGLEQAFTNAAMSRLRDGLLQALERGWRGSSNDLCEAARSLCKLLDLDMAIIHDAYEVEYVRRQREIERQRSEAAFRKLVEAAGSLIFILRPDLTIAYLNPFAEQLLGYTKATVSGKDYLPILLPEHDWESVSHAIHEVLAGHSLRGHEVTLRCRNGAERWVVWNAQRLDDFEGSPAVLAIGQDITDRKEATERALQSERLAAIGQTVAGLAHESRNAFQRSQACLELLALELEERPEQLELVSRIQRALDHLHRLYEEVRDYAAPIKLDRQLCDLAHLWRDAWSHLEINRKDRKLTLLEDAGAVGLECHADWFALGQVFRNILENAIAAVPDPGQIEIQCRDTVLDHQPAIQISIRDNGPGIPAEARDQVFDAFFTTKTKGTGLGMAIARRIVQAHGGRIELGDSPQGAEFLITLPR